MTENDARTGAAGRTSSAAAPPLEANGRRWLLLVHQLPTNPSNLRVRTWRRLQQIGAVPVKQAAYALPNTAGCREDFEWLKTDIEAAGGEAMIFIADAVDSWSDDALVAEFRRSREEAYSKLARDAGVALRRVRRRGQGKEGLPARALQQLQERLRTVEKLDFFGSPGRDAVVNILREIDERRGGGGASAPTALHSLRGQLWVTRPRPGVDRMASAWLIRRFIDPDARFAFSRDPAGVPENGVAFDMYGVELSHQNEGCTFETLCARFGIQDPAVMRIAQIVHDLDLKDARFGAAEAQTVGTVLDGLQLAHADDDELLRQGMAIFESLYRAFALSDRTTRAPGPAARAVAPARRARAASRRSK